MLKFVFSNSLNKSGAEHEKFALSRYISDISAALVGELVLKHTRSFQGTLRLSICSEERRTKSDLITALHIPSRANNIAY